MPFMDGLELAQEVKKVDFKYRIKIILVSADEPSEEFKYSHLFDQI